MLLISWKGEVAEANCLTLYDLKCGKIIYCNSDMIDYDYVTSWLIKLDCYNFLLTIASKGIKNNHLLKLRINPNLLDIKNNSDSIITLKECQFFNDINKESKLNTCNTTV